MEMKTKICACCKIEKELTKFVKRKNKLGVGSYCLECHNIKSKKYKLINPELVNKSKQKYSNSDEAKLKRKYWVKNNKQKISEYNKKRRIENRELLIKYYREYRDKNKNRINQQKKDWILNNPESRKDSLRKYLKKIKEDNIKYFQIYVRRNISMAFKFSKKPMVTEKILGCSIEQFRIYISSKFVDGMTLKNHGNGKGKWHLDHIIPISSATTEEEVIKLNHYTNFQPLWQIDNLRKSNKLNYEINYGEIKG